MFGAILGDIIGSPYEFDQGDKTKDFSLISDKSYFTDDTVMTLAIAKGIMDTVDWKDDELLKENMIRSMRKLGRAYPTAGYGVRFFQWLFGNDPKPYGSFGNGSAMRVSSVAWLFDDLEEVRRVARLSAEITHNHPEGIKGAEATASVIFLGRSGWDKTAIKQYVEKEFGYDLSRSCDEIRPGYYHVETCQQTVPEAITAFLEGNGLEDVLRTAVSLGGDCDTLAAIAGSMAEGYYGVTEEWKQIARGYLTEELKRILEQYERVAPK